MWLCYCTKSGTEFLRQLDPGFFCIKHFMHTVVVIRCTFVIVCQYVSDYCSMLCHFIQNFFINRSRLLLHAITQKIYVESTYKKALYSFCLCTKISLVRAIILFDFPQIMEMRISWSLFCSITHEIFIINKIS